MPRTQRAEFSLLTKLNACLARMTCPGLIEINRTCGKPLIDTKNTNFDHIMRNEIRPDNSVENCRPICHECHAIKTARDAEEAAKGRLIRKETKASRQPKAKIRSRNTLSKEYRDNMKKLRP
jgi:hypothetical protein